MLWPIGIILLVLWALGLFSGYTMGGVLHILLVIALVVVAVQVIQGRRRVWEFKPLPERVRHLKGRWSAGRNDLIEDRNFSVGKD